MSLLLQRIERVRREVLRARGFTPGTSNIQTHANRDAGGLDHRHAYQHASVLADEIERILQSEQETPAHIAVSAHLRATFIRLGWTEEGDLREWWPTHLEHILNEDAKACCHRCENLRMAVYKYKS